MDREQALHLLEHGTTSEQLRAARYLGKWALPKDREVIQRARAQATVTWLRAALDEALAATAAGTSDRPTRPDQDIGEPADTKVLEEISAQAIEETTGRLVHEIEPILGAARYFAQREIPGFHESHTRKELDRLADVLESLHDLRRAAAAPRIQEFDLAQVIREIGISFAAVVEDARVEVRYAGPEPLLVRGDPSLVAMALRNGLANAIEATQALGHSRGVEPVVVTWDETDRDYWITVLDRGVGLPAVADRALEIGTTNKPNHFGMGLAIARRAVQSLGGTVTLESREGGGARFEIRWPRVEGQG